MIGPITFESYPTLAFPDVCLIAAFPLHGTIFRLVVYADASPVEYAVVTYLRWQFEHKVTANFVMAKGCLELLKPTIVPRLELRAAI